MESLQYCVELLKKAGRSDSDSGDVDDRVESDISGVALDDSDPDLSSISYNLDQLELMQGDVIRTYKHRPNSSLNTLLTLLALLTLCTTVGVAIGHYLGSSRDVTLRSQQGMRIKEIQDEYLSCLRSQGLLEAQVSITDAQKIAAVTAVWKEKYEELIIEKVELEAIMKQLQKQMDDGLLEARDNLMAQRQETVLIVDDINKLNNQHQDNLGRHLSLRQTRFARREAYLREREVHVEKREMSAVDMEAQIALRDAQIADKEAKSLEEERRMSEIGADIEGREARLLERETRLAEDGERLVQTEASLKEWEVNVVVNEVVLQAKQTAAEETEIELDQRVMKLNAMMSELDERRASLESSASQLDDREAWLDDLTQVLKEKEVSLDSATNQRNEGGTNVGTIKEDELDESSSPLRPSPLRPPLVRQQAVDLENTEVEPPSQLIMLRDMQDTVNLLETENADLRHQVALSRYSAYQHTEMQLPRALQEKANMLANENRDLKTVVGRLRYSGHVANPNLDEGRSQADLENRVDLDTEEDLPESLQLSPQPDTSASPQQLDADSPEVDASPRQPDGGMSPEVAESPRQPDEVVPPANTESLWSYLNLLLPDLDLHDLQKVISISQLVNIPQPLVRQVEFLQNLTENVDIKKTVALKWEELRQLVSSDNIDIIGQKAEQIVSEISNIFHSEHVKFQNYMDSEEFKQRKDVVKTRLRSVVEMVANSTPVARYQEFVNKTKESVSELSQKIKKTWHKVKNLTGDFLDRNHQLNKLGDSISKRVKKIGESLESGWKKVQKHIERNSFSDKDKKEKSTDCDSA